MNSKNNKSQQKRVVPLIVYSDNDQTKDLSQTPKREEEYNIAEPRTTFPIIKPPQTVLPSKTSLPFLNIPNPQINSDNSVIVNKSNSPSPQKAGIKKLFTYVQGHEGREYFEQLSKRGESQEDRKKEENIPVRKSERRFPRGSFFIPEARRMSVSKKTYKNSNSCCDNLRSIINGCCGKRSNKINNIDDRRGSIIPNYVLSTSTSNRFAHLQGEEKSLAIRQLWRGVVHKIGVLRRTVGVFRILKDYSAHEIDHPPKFLVMPGSKFRICWDMISIVLLLYISIMTPFIVSYLDDIPQAFTHLETAISVLFFADIILNFFTPYLSHNILITSHKQIAKNYLKTWFILDVIASMPFHLIIKNDDSQNNVDWTGRIPRMLTMLKLFKLGRLLQFIQLFMDKIALHYKIKPDSSRRMSYFVGVLFVVHIFTCAWYLQARMSGFHPDTWVMRYGYYDEALFYKYFLSCFWVCQTLTTVVYGDYQPNTFYERLLCFVLMIFGVAFYSSLFSTMSEREKTLRYKILTLANLSSQTKLPPELMAKIRHNIEMKYDNDDGPQMILYRQLLEELSSSLKTEVVRYMYRTLIRKIRFFNDKPPEFLWKIIPKLKSISFKKAEQIFKPNDQANEIYFVKEGIVLLETESHQQITSFAQGSYFGDTEILSLDMKDDHQIHPRRTFAIALENTELLAIDKTLFIQAISEFPEVEEAAYKTHKIRELRQMQMDEGHFNASYFYDPAEDEPDTIITQALDNDDTSKKYESEEESKIKEDDSSNSSSIESRSTYSIKNSGLKGSKIEGNELEGKRMPISPIGVVKRLTFAKNNSSSEEELSPQFKTDICSPSFLTPIEENKSISIAIHRKSALGIPNELRDKIIDSDINCLESKRNWKNSYMQEYSLKNNNLDENNNLEMNENIQKINDVEEEKDVDTLVSIMSEVLVLESEASIPTGNPREEPILELQNIQSPVTFSSSKPENFQGFESALSFHKYDPNNINKGPDLSIVEILEPINEYEENINIHPNTPEISTNRCLIEGEPATKLNPLEDCKPKKPRWKKSRKKSIKSELKLSPSMKGIGDQQPTNLRKLCTISQFNMRDSSGNLFRPNLSRLQNKHVTVTTNCSSQQKTIRLFVKDLKSDLLRVVDVIFSALLNKIAECQALNIIT